MATAITSEDAFLGWLLESAGELHVLFCYADWHEPSKPGGAMDVVITSLAERYSDVDFAKMDVDAMSDLAEQLELSAVPSFFFFKASIVCF